MSDEEAQTLKSHERRVCGIYGALFVAQSFMFSQWDLARDAQFAVILLLVGMISVHLSGRHDFKKVVGFSAVLLGLLALITILGISYEGKNYAFVLLLIAALILFIWAFGLGRLDYARSVNRN